MKDIVAEAEEWSGVLPGQGDGQRKFVMMVLTTPLDPSVSIVNNLKILSEGGYV